MSSERDSRGRLRAAVARDPSAAERFLREARASVALGSRHVARVLDVGRLESGAPYMVMEVLAGEDLAHVLRRTGPLPIATAVGLWVQACDALAEAHALGIVHRDLKPANLFMSTTTDRAPLLRVLDFGISKAAGLGVAGVVQSLTESGVVMGSPGYMSPEQIRNSKDVDARSDVWSLGVILYELLTGVSPFVAESMGDTFARIMSTDPAPLRQLRPDVPTDLARVVEGCLERKPASRIDSVATLASKLAEFAPEDSRPILQRIRRLSRSAEPALRQETLIALGTVLGTEHAPLAGTPGETGTGLASLRDHPASARGLGSACRRGSGRRPRRRGARSVGDPKPASRGTRPCRRLGAGAPALRSAASVDPGSASPERTSSPPDAGRGAHPTPPEHAAPAHPAPAPQAPTDAVKPASSSQPKSPHEPALL